MKPVKVRFVFLCLLCIVTICGVPALGDGSTFERSTLNLDGKWQACLDANNRGEDAGYYRRSVSIDGSAVDVPADFSDISGAKGTYVGPGWFRRSFNIPENFKGRCLVLRFGAVNNQSKVWLNGKLLGENLHPHLPFRFDITDKVNYGAENFLAVKADTTTRTDTVPGSRIGWFPFGGIIRGVDIIAKSQISLEKIHVTAAPEGSEGQLKIETSITNRLDAGLMRIAVEILDSKNNTVKTLEPARIFIPANQNIKKELTATVPGIIPWSPDSPVLYTARLRLYDTARLRLYDTARLRLYAGDELVDSGSVDFGFREVHAANAHIYLNDKPVFLTGFNRHEDTPTENMCLDRAYTEKDLRKMKEEFGCNFIRLAHYPQHPEILEMCDRIGLLAMVEMPLYMWKGIEESGLDYNKKYKLAKEQLTKIIDTYFNHPSVIMWSVSNETWTQYPEVVGTNVKLVATAKRLDPSRLALHVSDHWRPDLPNNRSRQDHFGEDDVICTNGYPHRIYRRDGEVLSFWHEDVSGAKIDPDLIAKFWSDGLEMLHAEYPDKPVLVSEYGWRSDRGDEQHKMFIEAGACGMKKPWLAGVTIWCWADHPWPTEDQQKMRISPYGIYTRDREPKPAVESTKKVFGQLRDYAAENIIE